MSIVQTSREDKEKGLWRQQISLSCAKEVSAPLMGKLLMWPFEKVLWWCCRAKDIPRDRHGEAYSCTSDNCECAARKCLTPSCISALCHKALLMEALDVAL